MTVKQLTLKVQEMQLEIKKLKAEILTLNGGTVERGVEQPLNIDGKIQDNIKRTVTIEYINKLYRTR